DGVGHRPGAAALRRLARGRRVRGDHDDRDRGERRIAALLRHEGVPVHDRHEDVEQDDADRGRPEHAQRPFAVGRLAHAITFGLQQRRQRLARVEIVFDDQNTLVRMAHATSSLSFRRGGRPGSTRVNGRRSSTRGSVTVKVAPCPTPALSTATRPPWASTRCRTIARPSPRPPWRRVAAGAACLNRSNTWGRKWGAIPSPVSLTTNRSCWSERSIATRTVPPAGVNFTALLKRFQAT